MVRSAAAGAKATEAGEQAALAAAARDLLLPRLNGAEAAALENSILEVLPLAQGAKEVSCWCFRGHMHLFSILPIGCWGGLRRGNSCQPSPGVQC